MHKLDHDFSQQQYYTNNKQYASTIVISQNHSTTNQDYPDLPIRTTQIYQSELHRPTSPIHSYTWTIVNHHIMHQLRETDILHQNSSCRQKLYKKLLQ